MTAPTPRDRPELTCWLCGNLGAIRKMQVLTPDLTAVIVGFIPFQFDPAKSIRLDRGEHVCPACHGSHNPHRTEFPIRLSGSAS